MTATPEHRRLALYRERKGNWKHWGPYLSERAWGTVREDYSPGGTAWEHFLHDHARSRAYRWNEDGLAGICDRHQHLCFALALWNGRDPILKERLFGLTGPQGNHGEDVKEIYFYLDSAPTHSYMKMLYRYPQATFPYAELVAENGRRGQLDPEYELLDTGVFDEDRYYDVFVEYAKASRDDILVLIRVINRGPDAAPCHILPTLWFRNTWSWGYQAGPMGDVPGRPAMRQVGGNGDGVLTVEANHPTLGTYTFYAEGASDLLFTENETNYERLFGVANPSPYVKDSFHHAVVQGEHDAVNPDRVGTKAAAVFHGMIEPGQTRSVRVRLSDSAHAVPFRDFDEVFQARVAETDAFYAAVQNPDLTQDERLVQRQAFAGLLWTKQLYYIDIPQWLDGDPDMPTPPGARRRGRNHNWTHLNNFDIISMPDKWEYPWYASWDLAFHCIPLALVDTAFAKRQLVLMTREWFMHPNGQLPAYEWDFGNVNPPVHAWATWRVYKICANRDGVPDYAFLEGVFHKLLMNFTWWVNREDPDGRNVFQGGFLGLDNISLFDRSQALPTGGHIDQSDGTAWMGFYSLEMMKIALELAKRDPVYQDLATKFFEHFLRIATAMTNCGGQGISLWDPEDQFFYDILHTPDGSIHPLKVRSLVGLLPLLAVETIEADLLEAMPDFERRMRWFLRNRPELSGSIARLDVPGLGRRYLATILTRERLQSILKVMLDEGEFLSPYGIRSLSKVHQARPYRMTVGGRAFTIDYQPAEAEGDLFGGNSNWRGPVWFPINYLIIEALQRFHHYHGDDLKVECPTGSGNLVNLNDVATELSRRLIRLFLPDEEGRRPIHGDSRRFQDDPLWRDRILFYEYFHGDHGVGLGASHQTGWTALVAKLIQQSGGSR